MDGDEYSGVWRLWKAASLALFAVFVGAMLDCARTLRRLESDRRYPPYLLNGGFVSAGLEEDEKTSA